MPLPFSPFSFLFPPLEICMTLYMGIHSTDSFFSAPSRGNGQERPPRWDFQALHFKSPSYDTRGTGAVAIARIYFPFLARISSRPKWGLRDLTWEAGASSKARARGIKELPRSRPAFFALDIWVIMTRGGREKGGKGGRGREEDERCH